MEQAFVNLPYILAGMSLRTMFIKNPVLILIVSISSYLVMFFNPIENINILYNFGIAVFISTSIISLLVILSNYINYAWLAIFGRASMGIYLSHTIFSAFARSIMVELKLNEVVLHIFVGISVGLLVPLIIFISIKNQKTLKFMGW
jgi:hypothetical protein